MNKWTQLTPQFPSTDDLVVVGRKKTEDETGHYLRYARAENGVLSIRDVPGFFLFDAEALAFASRLDEVRALVNYLREQEWFGDRTKAYCLDCGHTRKEGHMAGCQFVSILTPFEEVT